MTVKKKEIHDELKYLFLKKLVDKFYDNFNDLEKNCNYKNRLKIIHNILNMTYNNYDILPLQLKLVCYDRCLSMKADCKSKIKDNNEKKSPWYKKHNKSLENIICLCDKIAN